MSTWAIRITRTARSQIAAITDKRIRKGIGKVIDRLAIDPDKQGKPMRGKLAGHRSVRAVGQRYRIIYKLETREHEVVVVLVGIRREGSRDDVYAQAERLADTGALDDNDK